MIPDAATKAREVADESELVEYLKISGARTKNVNLKKIHSSVVTHFPCWNPLVFLIQTICDDNKSQQQEQ